MMEMIPEEVCSRYGCVAISLDENIFEAAMADPLELKKDSSLPLLYRIFSN